MTHAAHRTRLTTRTLDLIQLLTFLAEGDWTCLGNAKAVLREIEQEIRAEAKRQGTRLKDAR